MEQAEKISGVFSSQEIHKVGTGTTTRRSIRKSYWFCTESESGGEAGSIEVQPLNANYIPSGPKRIIDKETFLNEFAPEPEFYQNTVFPRMRDITKTVARAERHRGNGELFSAEMEFNNALSLDVDNVRANFGLGLTYMARGETAKAENILERIVKLDGAFAQEHKLLFNELGIQLRKNKMIKDALAYYKRALDFSSQDENLHYNIARAHLENQDPSAALEHLFKALELNSEFKEAEQFLMWLQSKNLIPESKKQRAAAVLKKVQEDAAKAAAPDTRPDAASSAAEASGTETPAASGNPGGNPETGHA
jgi:tetratricopeptide (TPR) repeat protein